MCHCVLCEEQCKRQCWGPYSRLEKDQRCTNQSRTQTDNDWFLEHSTTRPFDGMPPAAPRRQHVDHKHVCLLWVALNQACAVICSDIQSKYHNKCHENMQPHTRSRYVKMASRSETNDRNGTDINKPRPIQTSQQCKVKRLIRVNS